MLEHSGPEGVRRHQQCPALPYDRPNGVEYCVCAARNDTQAAEGAVQKYIVPRPDPNFAHGRNNIRLCDARTAAQSTDVITCSPERPSGIAKNGTDRGRQEALE